MNTHFCGNRKTYTIVLSKSLKYGIAILLFFAFNKHTLGQTNNSRIINPINFEAYLGISIGNTLDGALRGFNGTFIFDKWGFCIEREVYSFMPKNVPDDYNERLFYTPSPLPENQINSITARVIKYFPTRSGKVKYGFELGISTSNYDKREFYIKQQGTWKDDKYSSFSETYSMYGISLKAKITTPLINLLGMDLALVSDINKYQSFIGCEFQLNIGYIRNTYKLSWPSEDD